MRNVSGFLARLNRKGLVKVEGSIDRGECLFCDASLQDDITYQRYRVCPQCRFHYSITARERIQQLVDVGSFKESHRSLISLDLSLIHI